MGWRDLRIRLDLFAWRSPAEVLWSAAQPCCVGGRDAPQGLGTYSKAIGRGKSDT
jgi:hypothetical protein